MWPRLKRREPPEAVAVDFEAAVAEAGLPYPNPRPFRACAAVVVIWNEEARIEGFLLRLRPWFEHIVVCVQESTDRSLEIARRMARPEDVVLEDRHRGFAEASAPLVARAVRTEWALALAADERPSDDLLASVGTIVRYAERHAHDGVWVPFRTTVEGIPFGEAPGHPRIIRRGVVWPTSLHRRPVVSRPMWWPRGHIDHDRSLDELVLDYLRYLELGAGNELLTRHNTRMIRDGCAAVAARDGWDSVRARPWWPRARAIASP